MIPERFWPKGIVQNGVIGVQCSIGVSATCNYQERGVPSKEENYNIGVDPAS